jgi:ABC-type nitrate/sulfonate/bicarbonate transport system ATPase subunit/ABC-type nitrate/sulfonate/bicarbonate transport system permease component
MIFGRQSSEQRLPSWSEGARRWAREVALPILSLAGLLLLWFLLSRTLTAHVLPGPVDTFSFAVREFSRGALLYHLGATLQRVSIAFSGAMLLGTLLGVAIGFSMRLGKLLEPWLVVGLTIPRIVLFVVTYLLFGLNDTAAVAALVLAVLPSVAVQVREGARALDPKLLIMAQAYRRRPAAIWRKVILPQLLPYLIGTARAALSLSWKMVILAELLGRTSGVGYQIAFYFQMFNMRGILAYGLAMMLILMLIDLTFMQLTRYNFRWRTPPEHPPLSAMAGIRMHQLSKRFALPQNRTRLVLDTVDLQVQEGEFICLLGPSGSGKTTLLNIVSGIEQDYEGQVAFTGTTHHPIISYMFQEPRLLPWLTVKQNLEFVLDEPQAEVRTQQIAKWLERVGLEEFGSYYPGQLSTGMQQRVAVARALVIEPEILLMDEPFSSLDELTALQMRKHLLTLWSVLRCTVVFVTHNPLEAVFLADRIVMMTAAPGRIATQMDLRTELPRPRDIENPRLWQLSREVVRGFLPPEGGLPAE